MSEKVWYEKQPDMTNEIWFRAVNDSREVCCEKDSVASKLLAQDRNFVRVDGPKGIELAPEFQGPEPIVVDLSWMTTAEKIQLAKTILSSV